MYVLHGVWATRLQRFVIWGEDVRKASLAVRQGNRGTAAQHPFSLTYFELEQALHTLTRKHPAQLTMQLPGVGRRPEASWMARSLGAATPTEKTTPLFWKVDGLALLPDATLPFLLELPPLEDGVYDSDIYYWQATARLIIRIVETRNYIPGIPASRYTTQAFWQSNLPPNTFVQLSKDMPEVCFGGNSTTLERATILYDFVEIMLAEFLETHLEKLARERFTDPLLRTLTNQDYWLNLPPAKIQHYRSVLEDMTTHVVQTRGFRLCLRLIEPHEGSEDWRLEYLLQDGSEPHVLLSAHDLQDRDSVSRDYLRQRGHHPVDLLLPLLGKAAPYFPPIEASLTSRLPTGVNLSPEQAFEFLAKAAQRLEKADITVLVPDWWTRRKRTLRAQVTLQESSGLLGGDALFDFRWQLALGDTSIDKEEFERLVALKQPLVQFKGEWVELDDKQIEAAREFFQQNASQGQVNVLGALKLSANASKVNGDSAIEVLPAQASATVGKLLKKLRNPDRTKPPAIPPQLQASLRPYQERGFGWLVQMRQMGLGACLADDMGLGKTVMTIALWLHEKTQMNVKGSRLLVCPTSVLSNWKHELDRFAPSLSVMLHYGSGRLSGKAFVEAAQAHDVILTSYALVHRDLATLKQVNWGSVTLDEAQNIKNPSTKQAQAVRSLSAEHRLALTGTPVENRLGELWSIFQFLNPGYLGSQQQFNANFANPIERHSDQEAVKALKQLIAPFILRRVKTDPKVIQDLPQKFENAVYCTLTAHQASLYEAVVRRELALIAAAESAMQRRGAVLRMLIYLKQICDHPALYEKTGSHHESSGKLQRLIEMLGEVLDNGERALIFTQYARMGMLLQKRLGEAFGKPPLFLYGGTPAAQRTAMIEAFQRGDEHPLFVLSLKAGGTGLNLTAASHVFHFDRWYNPAVENQATDRAFRIGQTKVVQVHKFICLGTLEERIDALIQQKQGLADQIIGAGEAWISELSDRELRDLVALQRTVIE
jgi:SNF2 family DNA or RNA helicase